MGYGKRSPNPQYTENAQRQQEYQHGLQRLACPSDGAACHLQDCQDPVKRAEELHNIYAVSYHILIVGKDADNLGREYQKKDSRHHRVEDSHPYRYKHALFYPVVLPGSYILSSKRGGSHTETEHRENIEPVNLNVGCKSRHGNRAETIDAGLDDDIGKRDDDILDSGGEANLDDLGKQMVIKSDIPDLHMVYILAPRQKQHDKDAGNQLADIRRQGCSHDAHLKRHHEQKVQKDIGDRGDHQVQQGSFGISHRIEDSGGHVVDHGKKNSSEIYLKISDCLSEHLRRRPHGPEDHRSQKDARCRQDDPCSDRDRDRRVDCLPYAFLIPGAEKLGDDDAGAGRRANAESDQQIDDGSAGAYGCQRLASYIVSYNDGIHRIIQLLE